MTDREVIEIFGKSIWDMTPDELIKNDLDIIWFHMVEEMEVE
jgi:hypothetical protein